MTTHPAYQLRPLSSGEAEQLRAAGGEVYVADEKPGYPCRRCLRDAEVGDELILTNFDPFDQDSPYRSASPIFIHRQPCEPVIEAELPSQLTVRQLSVRCFDSGSMMIDAKVIDGNELDGLLQKFFSNVEADYVHVHNASRGCWATTVTRPSSSG